jgi:peptidyl-prolyl cis-trans isomerase C
MRAFSFVPLENPMKTFLACLAVAAAASAMPAPAADDTLVVNHDITVTKADFDAYMERVPPEFRLEARSDDARNNKVVDFLFTNRYMAQQAIKAGLDKDPVIARRLQQNTELFLAQQYVNWLERNAPIPANLEARAKELYLSTPARFTEPARVELQHILIGLTGRTREMALERAKEVRAKALAGEDFLALAKKYSDDPGFKRDGGRLGAVTEKELDDRVATAAFALKSDGAISEPVETNFGFHLVKRIGFQPSYLRKFEDVKAAIIEQEKNRIRSEVSLKMLDAVRRSPETHWNASGIAALRAEIPHEQIQRRQREALEELEKKAKKAYPSSAAPADPAAKN